MWAVEGAGLLWLGMRQERKLPRLFGMLLQASAGVGYLIGVESMRSTQPILNTAHLGAVMLAVSGVLSGYWLFRNEARRATYEAGLTVAFTFWGIIWWFFGGANEIARYYPSVMLGSLLVYTSITAAILTWLGIARQWPLPRWIALFLPAVAGAYAFVHAQPLDHPFAQWGALGWLAIFVTHFSLLKIAEPQRHVAIECLHGGACLALGLRELRPSWPVAQHAIGYRLYGAVPIAVALCIWIVAINLGSSGDPAWLPYIPLLNPLD